MYVYFFLIYNKMKIKKKIVKSTVMIISVTVIETSETIGTYVYAVTVIAEYTDMFYSS